MVCSLIFSFQLVPLPKNTQPRNDCYSLYFQLFKSISYQSPCRLTNLSFLILSPTHFQPNLSSIIISHYHYSLPGHHHHRHHQHYHNHDHIKITTTTITTTILPPPHDHFLLQHSIITSICIIKLSPKVQPHHFRASVPPRYILISLHLQNPPITHPQFTKVALYPSTT